VTAGLDERLAADEETRSFDDFLIDRALEADVGAAEARIEVNPRKSICFMIRAACSAISESGSRALSAGSGRGDTIWTWQSMRPGIKVLPRRSMRWAEESLIGLSEISLMSPSATRTKRSCSPSSLEPSRMRAFSKIADCMAPQAPRRFRRAPASDDCRSFRPGWPAQSTVGGPIAKTLFGTHPSPLATYVLLT